MCLICLHAIGFKTERHVKENWPTVAPLLAATSIIPVSLAANIASFCLQAMFFKAERHVKENWSVIASRLATASIILVSVAANIASYNF